MPIRVCLLPLPHHPTLLTISNAPCYASFQHPKILLTKEIMLEVSSEGCVQNRQRAVGTRKEGLQARDISAKALGLEKRS